VQVDAPIMGVDDFPHDWQTKPRPLGLGREERIEDAVAQLGRDPRSVVRNVDNEYRGRLMGAAGIERIVLYPCPDHLDVDLSPTFQRFERVGQEVREDLAELVVVGVNHRQVGGYIEVEGHLATWRLALGEGHGLSQHVAYVGPLNLQPNWP